MSDRSQSIPAPIPQVCFFRHSALVNLPGSWRISLTQLGIALFDLCLELYGQAPETRSSLETTRAVLLAIALDLRTAHEQLEEVAVAVQLSELQPEESRLCRAAGSLAPQVRELSEALLRAVQT